MRTPSSHRSGDLTIILINKTHDFCERREYTFNVLSEYSIITPINIIEGTQIHKFNKKKKSQTIQMHPPKADWPQTNNY